MISNIAKELLENNLRTGLYNIHVAHDKLGPLELMLNVNDLYEIESFYIVGEAKESEQAFALGFLALLQKIGPLSITTLKFREVESYLRDDNSRPAWEGSIEESNWYENVKSCVLASFTHHYLMSKPVSIKTWEDLSYQQKLVDITEQINKVNFFLKILGLEELEFVNIEAQNIIIEAHNASVPRSELSIILSSFLEHIQFCYGSSLIKLVAQ